MEAGQTDEAWEAGAGKVSPPPEEQMRMRMTRELEELCKEREHLSIQIESLQQQRSSAIKMERALRAALEQLEMKDPSPEGER